MAEGNPSINSFGTLWTARTMNNNTIATILVNDLINHNNRNQYIYTWNNPRIGAYGHITDDRADNQLGVSQIEKYNGTMDYFSFTGWLE